MAKASRIGLVFSLALAALVALAGCGAPSAPAPTAAPKTEAAAPKAPAAPSLDAAKKEGKVVLYTSLEVTIAEKVAKAFTQDVGIEAEVVRAGGEQLAQRFLQEQSTGIHTADVFAGTGEVVYARLKKDGILTAYQPKGGEAMRPELKDKDNVWFVWYANLHAVLYNPTKIPDAEAPKNWKDVLDPKYKDKIVLPNPSFSPAYLDAVSAMLKVYGWDYYAQLAKNKPMLVQSIIDTSNMVVSGERPVAAPGQEASGWERQQKGNPVKVVYPADGVPFSVNPVSVVTKAPHPNAARLFMDYMFSKPGLQILVDAGRHVGLETNVTYPAGRTKMGDVKLMQPDVQMVSDKSQEMKDKFIELFGG